MDGNAFCTMGGMSHEMPMMMHHRKLMEAHQHHHHDQLAHGNGNKWDPGPAVVPDNGSQQHHEHEMDHHNHHDMNHDNMNDDSNMNHDHSSHNNNGMGNMSMGTVMYMDGFHSALFPSPNMPPPPCLNLFHPSWTLHTPTKFIFAMIFVAFIGVLVEACGVWRVKCLRKGRKFRRELRLKRLQAWEEQQQRQNGGSDMQGQQLEFRRQSRIQHGGSDISDVSSEGNNSHNNNSSAPPGVNASTSTNMMCPVIIRRAWRKVVPQFIRTICTKILCCNLIQQRMKKDGNMKTARRYDIAAALLHASRAWLGYLLMLSVMTYAIEFLISAVVGMVLGRYWFVDMEGGGGSANVAATGGGGGVMNGAVGVGGGIGGMGLGDAGGIGASGREQVGGQNVGLGMSDIQQNINENDGTWGGGGDPCCGIDDDDEDDHHNDEENGGLREPLLSSLVGSNNVGVTRRSAVGL